MSTQELCPLCGEGPVSAQTEQVENDYKGQKALLPQHFKLCAHCGSDFAGAAEAKLNKRALMAFRKQVDGVLTGAEIVALREQYKLTQAQAARLFGGGPVAFSKYENDDVAQSEAMDTLLRLVRRSADAFWALVDEKDMTAELVRPGASHTVLKSSAVYSIARQDSELSPHFASATVRTFRAGGVTIWTQ
jgi:HTH-type transcriptional regulator/antitoxin MqsA